MQKLIKSKVVSRKLKNIPFIESSNLELIRTLTLTGAGIGILPQRVVKAENSSSLKMLPDFPTFKDEIYLIYHQNALKSEAGKLLIACAKTLL